MCSSFLSVVAMHPNVAWLWFTFKDTFVLQLFGSVMIDACPYSTQDMLSLIARRGQNSDQISRFIPEKSHWTVRDKIYTEQEINCNEEPVLTVASVLKVRKYFT